MMASYDDSYSRKVTDDGQKKLRKEHTVHKW